MIGPGGTAPDDIDNAEVLTGIMAGEPVLILLTRFRVPQIAEDGVLISGDALESAVQARGAVPMTDLEFDRAPTPGWRAMIDGRRSTVQLVVPGDELLHIGSIAFESSWYQQVADRQRDGRGLVVITGAAAPTETAALEMIAAGLASWVRVAIELAL